MNRIFASVALAGVVSLSIAAHAANFGLTAGTPAPRMLTSVNGAMTVGWHGDRYWDGHRYWNHKEWGEHQRHIEDSRDHDRDAYRLRADAHCPLGQAKKGAC